MTLIFNGQQFKYEIESVVKLFIPVVHFDFLYENTAENIEGDYCLCERKISDNTAYLTAECKLDGKTLHFEDTLKSDIENFDGECEISLCSMVFKALSQLTDKKVGWGTLTGVRPVKRVNNMLADGMNENEIKSELKRRFSVSEEKSEIACLTAKTQQDIVRKIDDKAFALYVSIPFCPSRCSYCSFVSQEVEKSLELIPKYVYNLSREIEKTGEIATSLGLKLQSVYFGGGTPTSLEAHYLKSLMDTIRNSFDMSDVLEYTVEAGRADTITEDKLLTIKEMGADRVSINPQTLNNDVLKAIGRKHTVEDFFDKYNLARKIGFKTINTDLIAGLPTDTTESFKNTIDGIISLSPENVTVHTLSVKRTSNINVNGEYQVLKNPACEMVDYATKTLLEKGYNPYYLYKQKNMLDNLENIGWSIPDHESLYNVYIMEEIQTILAVGAGASTKLVDNKNSRLERIFNYKLPLEYIKNFDLMLKKKQDIERFYNFEKE